MVVTIGSVLTHGNMFDTRLLCYVLDNSRAMPMTVPTLDTWLTWSLTELQLGHFLDTDPWGRPLERYSKGRKGQICGDYKGILVVHKGDEKYMQKVYRLSHGAVSRHVCMLCEASSEVDSPYLYTFHGMSACHRSTRLSTSEFIEKVVGLQTFVRLPGFHVDFIQHDWLHVVDLSLIPECSASALVELVRESVWGGEGTHVDQRLRLGYVAFIKACKADKVKSRGVFFSMLLSFV